MGNYADCALKAIELIRNEHEVHPVEAWDLAADIIFPNSISSRKKSCPKNAFLGLCEDGLIIGIQAQKYTLSSHNKQYTIDAVNVLKKLPALLRDKHALWHKVCIPLKKHNGQMDVVIALWEAKAII